MNNNDSFKYGDNIKSNMKVKIEMKILPERSSSNDSSFDSSQSSSTGDVIIGRKRVGEKTAVRKTRVPGRLRTISTCSKSLGLTLTNNGTKRYFKPDNIHVCKICSRRFVSERNLKQHVLVVHEKNSAHKCTQCWKSFQCASHLKMHIRMHSKVQAFKCTWTGCDQRFNRNSNRNVHIATVHKRLKKYKWWECGAAFGVKRNLTVHSSIHTGEKPYKCDVCGRAFGDPSGMTRHLLVIHSSLRSHKCSLCGKGFAVKTERNRHEKRCSL